MDLASLNWLAILVAALSCFALGALWYGPLFGTAWMRGSGMTEERAASANYGLIFGTAFVLHFVTAVVLALFLGPDATFGFALLAAGSVGVFWVAPALGVIYLFEQRPLVHWAVNASYQVVAFFAMGAILGVWR